MIRFLICVWVTCAFVLLAMYSLEYQPETLSSFTDRKLAEYEASKWDAKQRQIAELWNITPKQATQPVILWSN